jgi:hypothetical protein
LSFADLTKWKMALSGSLLRVLNFIRFSFGRIGSSRRIGNPICASKKHLKWYVTDKER